MAAEAQWLGLLRRRAVRRGCRSGPPSPAIPPRHEPSPAVHLQKRLFYGHSNFLAHWLYFLRTHDQIEATTPTCAVLIHALPKMRASSSEGQPHLQSLKVTLRDVQHKCRDLPHHNSRPQVGHGLDVCMCSRKPA